MMEGQWKAEFLMISIGWFESTIFSVQNLVLRLPREREYVYACTTSMFAFQSGGAWERGCRICIHVTFSLIPRSSDLSTEVLGIRPYYCLCLGR